MTKGAIALATWVEWDKEGNGFGSKSNGDDGGNQLMTIRAMVTGKATTWAMGMVTRVAGNEEGNRISTSTHQWTDQNSCA